MWEVFRPVSGYPIVKTRYRVVARLVAWCLDCDYTLEMGGSING